MLNMLQLVGGSLGLAVLVAVFGTAYRGSVQHPPAGLTPFAQGQHAFAHGVGTAFLLAAIFDVACLLVILLLIRVKKAPAVPAPQQAPAAVE
jgi:hypothetical protein